MNGVAAWRMGAKTVALRWPLETDYKVALSNLFAPPALTTFEIIRMVFRSVVRTFNYVTSFIPVRHIAFVGPSSFRSRSVIARVLSIIRLIFYNIGHHKKLLERKYNR